MNPETDQIHIVHRLNRDKRIETTYTSPLVSSTSKSSLTTTTTTEITANSIHDNELKGKNEWSKNTSSCSNNSYSDGGLPSSSSSSIKRVIKCENEIEIDDSCSNDAFVFSNNQQQKKAKTTSTTTNTK